MLKGIVTDVKDEARAVARAAVVMILGALFALVGIAFLTAALWIFIANQESVLVAASVIGAIYVVIGLILLAIGRRGKHGVGQDRDADSEPSTAERSREPFVQLAEGFVLGMQAGRSAKSRRR